MLTDGTYTAWFDFVWTNFPFENDPNRSGPTRHAGWSCRSFLLRGRRSYRQGRLPNTAWL